MTNKEEKLQAECYLWFHNTFPLWRKMLFHVDNNSWNNIIGAKKKALGVSQGVSDLIFISFAEVTFIELKTETGYQSDEQKDFELKVVARGMKYIVIRNIEDFKKLIKAKISESNEYLESLANS